MKSSFVSSICLAIIVAASGLVFAEDDLQKLVIIAGKPSHPPRMHEFNAGV